MGASCSWPSTSFEKDYIYFAGNAPHILQVFEVGTATMMASKGAIKPVAEVMQMGGAKFDPGAYVPAVAGYYTAPNGQMLSFPFNSSTTVFYINKDAFKAAGLSSMLLNVKGADGKATQQVNPVFQEVVDNARLKTEGMMSSLKDKAGTAAALLDQLKQGAVGIAAKGIEALAPKPRMAGGVTDVDSFQRDLQSGALNAEKSAEETAKNTKRLLQEAQHGGLTFS